MTQSTSLIYTINNFGISNPNCAILTNVLIPASTPLVTMDQYATTGNALSSSVTMISVPAATQIQLSIPPITEVEHYYYFALRATANGGFTVDSDNIKIRLVNCAHTALSLPTPYTTPTSYFAQNVDSTLELSWIFTETTSDFIECRNI